MKKSSFQLTLLILVSFFVRLWKLGKVPFGLSLSEINYGLYISKYLGSWVLDSFVIRLPFVVLGVLSIYLIFQFVRKIGKNHELAFFSSLIIAFLPWHITQSRIFSPSLLLFVITLTILILFFPKRTSFFGKIGKWGLVLAIMLFAFSIIFISDGLATKVNQQRQYAINIKAKYPLRLLSNKLIESYRFRENLLFENLDFGNYFFKGHPRERWGVEEPQKLFIALLPLLFLGVVKMKKEFKGLLVAWGSLAITIPVALGLRDPASTFFLTFPVVVLAGGGVINLLKRDSFFSKALLTLITIVFVFEFMTFSNDYFFEGNESGFSPRRPIYKKLVTAVDMYANSKHKVLVSEKLGNPRPFFKFFLRDNSLDNFEFRTFDVWTEENLDKIFVDVLPDNALPNEPLYTDSGDWPKELKVLDEFYDNNLRQKVVIYRM